MIVAVALFLILGVCLLGSVAAWLVINVAQGSFDE